MDWQEKRNHILSFKCIYGKGQRGKSDNSNDYEAGNSEMVANCITEYMEDFHFKFHKILIYQ